jgi:hypothetical protein
MRRMYRIICNALEEQNEGENDIILPTTKIEIVTILTYVIPY